MHASSHIHTRTHARLVEAGATDSLTHSA